MKFRLSFAEIAKPDVKFWSERLRSCGVTIVSEKPSGIDAEGDVESIEKALDTKVDLSDESTPRIGAVKLTGKPGEPAPIAYVPRKPTYFE